MREEVRSSGTMDPRSLVWSSSPPPTPAASSAGATSPAVPTNIGTMDWFGSTQGPKAGCLSRTGSQNPRTSMSTNVGDSTRESIEPSCRPWERGDLLRRLATFKPSNWFEKLKDASSLACARRGWMNIDTDKIECELCGVQHIFTALPNWTHAEADRAGEAFAEQLNVGHKVTCPWRGIFCADSLVQFPPIPPSALIGGYKDRCDGLVQFPSLPVIASIAIEKMRLSRGTQIDRFLSQLHTYSSGRLGLRAENTPGMELSREDALSVYCHAQKLISLCGWEPRWLPNVQDYEEHSSQSARNASSFGPSEEKYSRYRHAGTSKNAFSASTIKESGKKKKPTQELRSNSRSPLLDCSLCGATVKIWDFVTVSCPTSFALNNRETTDTSKKMVLKRGGSAASGINGWVAADGTEKDQIEGRDEAAIADEGKSLSNAGVDLNLTIAGGLPSTQPGVPAMSENFDDTAMGRDLMIGQPSGSEVGDLAASYESQGPSTMKRNLEEGGSTVDRPPDRLLQADSLEGTVIDHDGDEVDDGRQCSDGPSKRVRGLDIFDIYNSSCRMDSDVAGPSRTLCFDIGIDVNRVDSFKEGSDLAAGFQSAKGSARASSVIAMDTVCHSGDGDSMESVENYPGDDDAHFPSASVGKSIDMNEGLELNYSSQAQQSTFLRPAAGSSAAREVGVSSTNEGEEILNAETVTAPARDRLSFGVSGGSIGMGASHEAEIHGIDISARRADSTVGDADPIAEVTENIGQTGESAPGLMGEFAPGDMDREDPHGDSQDMISQSVRKADSSSKIYGSAKADSVDDSGEKISNTFGRDSSAHPSLSCNGVICSGYEVSKGEVKQKGRASVTDDCAFLTSECVPINATGAADGENDFVAGGEFDPIKHHNIHCPWVNGNVAAAGCSSNGSSSSTVALCGWELTLDALDTLRLLGHIPNQPMQSESAASLNKDDQITHGHRVLARHSISKSQGQQ